MSDQETESCIIEENDAMTSEEKPAGESPMDVDNNQQGTIKEKKSKNGFVSRRAEYEEMFKDRYTNEDPAYLERVESKLQPLIIHPFAVREQQQQPWQNRRNDGRQFGGGRGHRNYNGRNRGGGGRWEQRR